MFKITTNREIKINRGDDSGKFPLFINKGTAVAPLRYEFLPKDVELIINSSTIKSATVDIDTFKRNYSNTGVYTFTYLSTGWNYLGQVVDIATIGIKYAGKPTVNDSIAATVSVNKEEVYLYIYDINSDWNKYRVKKTFTRNGVITTDYNGVKAQRVEKDSNIINSDGDMMLRIDSEDTVNLRPGEYRYVIKAKIWDTSTQSYVINTIIEEHPFYITSDNISQVYNEEELIFTNLPVASSSSSDDITSGVESVNGYTGVVVIDYEDVGADEEGAADTALTNAKEYTDTTNTTTNTRITTEVETLNTTIDTSAKNINTRINKEVVYLNDRIDNLTSDQEAKLAEETRQRKEEDTKLNKRIDDLDYEQTFARVGVLETIKQENGLISTTTRDLIRSDFDTDFFAEHQIQELPEDLATLQTNIDNEATRATTAETALNKRIDDLDHEQSFSRVSVLKTIKQENGQLSTEVRDLVRDDFDTDFFAEHQIEQLPEDLAQLQTNITAEETRAKAAEKVLTDNLASEVSRAKAAEELLTSNLNQEIQDRKDDVDAEEARAKAAEETLTNNLNSEITRATGEETRIENKFDEIIDNLDYSIDIPTGKKVTKITQTNGLIGVTTDTLEQADVNGLETRLTNIEAKATNEETERKAADATLTADVATINSKIPEQASSDNQLADKDFVNSSIATSTATFRGTYDSVDDLPTTGIDINDYAFVKVLVEGSTVYDRYKYDGTQWKFEYRLNNSSFTAAQWASINSGMTNELRTTLTSANSVGGYGWKDADETVHKIDTDYVSTKSSASTNVLMSDGNGNASWQVTVSKVNINNDEQPITSGSINIKTDGKSVLYDSTSKEIKLPDEWAAYLKKQVFKIPTIDTLVLKDGSGSTIASTYELGVTKTVSTINHKESNISNIDGNLTFNGTDTITPSATAVDADVTDIDVSSTKTLTITGKYTDTVGVEQTISMSATITFYRYAYTSVTNSTTAPTTGTKRNVLSTFASSGASISYSTGDYIYFYTEGTGKTVQCNVMGTWANVDTTSIGKVTLTQENGTTHEYDCYRVGPFGAGGTDTYRV